MLLDIFFFLQKRFIEVTDRSKLGTSALEYYLHPLKFYFFRITCYSVLRLHII